MGQYFSSNRIQCLCSTEALMLYSWQCYGCWQCLRLEHGFGLWSHCYAFCCFNYLCPGEDNLCTSFFCNVCRLFADCLQHGRTETQLERLCQSEQSAWVTAAWFNPWWVKGREFGQMMKLHRPAVRSHKPFWSFSAHWKLCIDLTAQPDAMWLGQCARNLHFSTYSHSFLFGSLYQEIPSADIFWGKQRCSRLPEFSSLLDPFGHSWSFKCLRISFLMLGTVHAWDGFSQSRRRGTSTFLTRWTTFLSESILTSPMQWPQSADRTVEYCRYELLNFECSVGSLSASSTVATSQDCRCWSCQRGTWYI